MAITLDSVTQAEYLAQPLAASRATLIRDALTSPVLVRVYRSQQAGPQLMGSGTMADPWCSVSGATVTIGEVNSSGFAVAVAGIPDGSWYLQFEGANGRTVRGGFGLTGSGADFTWSLASFAAGGKGTIGTASLTATGVATGSGELFTGSGNAANEAQFSTLSGTETNYPARHLVAFKKGVVPPGSYVVATVAGAPLATQQCDIKTRWLDGSVQSAIMSYIVPTVTTTPTTVAFSADSTNRNGSAPALSATQTAVGSAGLRIQHAAESADVTRSLSSMLGALSGMTTPLESNAPALRGVWSSGATCVDYVVSDHAGRTLDVVRANGARLRPVWEVTHWPTIGLVEVQTHVEISDTEGWGDWQGYTATITDAAGATLWTQASIPHHAGSWWGKTFTVAGTAPNHANVRFVPPWKAWRDAGLILNYPDVTIESAWVTSRETTWNNTTAADRLNAYGMGGYAYKNMGTTGARAEIGPYTTDQIIWMYSGSPVLRTAMLRMSETAGHFGGAIREGKNAAVVGGGQRYALTRLNNENGRGYPISTIGRPTWNFGGFQTTADDALTTIGTRNTNGWSGPDGEHTPQAFQIPYLGSGAFLHLDRLSMWALTVGDNTWDMYNWNTDAPNPYSRNRRLRYYGELQTKTGDTRTQAWMYKLLVDGYQFFPDAHPLKRAFYEHVLDGSVMLNGSLGLGSTADYASMGADIQANYTWAGTIANATRRTSLQFLVPHYGASSGSRLTLKVPLGGVSYGTEAPLTAQAGVAMAPWQFSYYMLTVQRAYEANVPMAWRWRSYYSEFVRNMVQTAQGAKAMTGYRMALTLASTGGYAQSPAEVAGAMQSSFITTATPLSSAPNHNWADVNHDYAHLLRGACAVASEALADSTVLDKYNAFLDTYFVSGSVTRAQILDAVKYGPKYAPQPRL